VASVPPLLDDLEARLRFSPTVGGLLTSLPVLCFGLVALAAPPLARRIGTEAVLLAALVPLTIGTALRAAGSTGALFAGTVLAGAGVALANVIAPAIIKGRYPRRIGLLTGLYTGVLSGGAALAGGISVPVADAAGWRASLALWAVPAAATTLLVAVAVARDPGVEPPPTAGTARSLLRNGLAWQVTLFFGFTSALFYSGLTWLPSILRDAGFSPSAAGGLLAVYALLGIPASLAAPSLAMRRPDQRLLACAFPVLEIAAVAGLLVAPHVALLWVPLYALGQGGAFSTALTLIVLRTSDSRRSAELSGMTQALGYVLSAGGPLLVGALHDATGGWTAPLLLLLCLGAPLLVVAFGAGRPLIVP
jgi:CP family cyanate transporter-like MFS transporter